MTQVRREPARLDQPRELRRRLFPARRAFNSDAFGVFAEKFARFMGTARFLVWMTVFVIVWVLWNIIALFGFDFDPYPFILLNLFFSTQASYAAPLILLAQNRQDDRDRVTLEQDRARDERNLADTEYLTREVASLRIAMRDIATRDFLRSELRDLVEELAEQRDRDCPHCGRPTDEPARAPKKGRHAKPKDGDGKAAAHRTSEPDPIAEEARARLSGER